MEPLLAAGGARSTCGCGACGVVVLLAYGWGSRRCSASRQTIGSIGAARGWRRCCRCSRRACRLDRSGFADIQLELSLSALPDLHSLVDALPRGAVAGGRRANPSKGRPTPPGPARAGSRSPTRTGSRCSTGSTLSWRPGARSGWWARTGRASRRLIALLARMREPTRRRDHRRRQAPVRPARRAPGSGRWRSSTRTSHGCR